MYTHTYAHIHTPTHTCIYAHTRTHTHTHTRQIQACNITFLLNNMKFNQTFQDIQVGGGTGEFSASFLIQEKQM